jgi:hypothetical protein
MDFDEDPAHLLDEPVDPHRFMCVKVFHFLYIVGLSSGNDRAFSMAGCAITSTSFQISNSHKLIDVQRSWATTGALGVSMYFWE